MHFTVFLRPCALSLLALCLVPFAQRATHAQETQAAPATATVERAEPASVAVLIDTSASMNDPDLGKMLRESFKRIVESSGGRDAYFVVEVATAPELRLDWETDAEKILKAVNKVTSVRKLGATALWDACALSAEKLAAGKNAKRFIVLISDGVDTLSDLTAEDARKAVGKSGARLLAVGVRQKNVLVTKHPADLLAELGGLASASGGELFRPKKASEIDSITDKIIDALRR